MKIKISKNQWEKIGNESGWRKSAQNVAPAPQQAAQVAAQPQQAPAAQSAQPAQPVQSKTLQIMEQSLKQLEMQANSLPLNGQKIRVLIGQIRQLAKTDPGA